MLVFSHKLMTFADIIFFVNNKQKLGLKMDKNNIHKEFIWHKFYINFTAIF